jgi:hypothetical protein
MYVLTPHNYVALCLAARFSELGARSRGAVTSF